MRSSFTIVSIVVHATVVAGALVAQLLAVGPLPTPRQLLTFEGARLVRVADIRVANPSRHAPRGGDSLQALDQAAVDAVKQWRFTPTRLNGVPIPIVMTVTVQFRLQNR
jgi:TonB family protein